MFKNNKINRYIITEYLKLFFLIYSVLLTIVFLVDFLEISNNMSKYAVPLSMKLKIVICEIPKMIDDFIQFVIMLTTAITLKKLSLRNELTILYINKVSLWKILKIFSFITTVIAIVLIFVANPIINKMNIMSRNYKSLYRNQNDSEFLESKNSFWFKQQDIENDRIIVTKTDKINIKNFTFKNNVILIFDKNDMFLERLNVDNMILENGFFTANNVYKYKLNSPIEYVKNMTIPTNLKHEIVLQELKRKHENVNNMNIYKIISTIREFKKVNINTNKFETKMITFLTLPIIFFIMNMIACIVVSNNNRNSKTITEMFIIIIISVFFYITQNIIYELSLAEKINYIRTIGFCIFINILFCTNKLIKKIELINY